VRGSRTAPNAIAGGLEQRGSVAVTDCTKIVVYSVMVDRFANGDITNDLYNIPHYQKQVGTCSEYLEGAPAWDRLASAHLSRELRLSYMKHLGATVVALSPVFLNSGGEYHGYSISDLSKIDPGFGDAKLLQALVAEAGLRLSVKSKRAQRAKGGRFVHGRLDVQVNHAVATGLEYRSVHMDPVSQVSNCVASFEEVYRNTSGGQPKRSPGTPTDSYTLVPSWHQRSLSFGVLPRHLHHQEFFARCGPKRMDRPNNHDFSNEPHDSEEYEACACPVARSLWLSLSAQNHKIGQQRKSVRRGICAQSLS
ncbi:tvaII, partial [Symbiodinium necroappetens]